MRILKVKKCVTSDGPGIRLSIYCSGCENFCVGCHGKDTWDFNLGVDYKAEGQTILEDVLKELSHDYYRGLTLCGGEPLHKNNVDGFLDIVKKVKEKLPSKDIWCYTGYEWEQVKDLEIMQYIDVAVVGPFILAQRDISDNNMWRGSRNQRVIDVKASLVAGKRVYLPGIPNNS